MFHFIPMFTNLSVSHAQTIFITNHAIGMEKTTHYYAHHVSRAHEFDSAHVKCDVSKSNAAVFNSKPLKFVFDSAHAKFDVLTKPAENRKHTIFEIYLSLEENKSSAKIKLSNLLISYEKRSFKRKIEILLKIQFICRRIRNTLFDDRKKLSDHNDDREEMMIRGLKTHL